MDYDFFFPEAEANILKDPIPSPEAYPSPLSFNMMLFQSNFKEQETPPPSPPTPDLTLVGEDEPDFLPSMKKIS